MASGGTSAIKEALRNIRRGTPTREAEEPGAAINVYVGAAQPSSDEASAYPDSIDDDDDEEG